MATAHAAIASLPCELLIEIFIACACADPLSPLILEQVCRQWTEVANTTPHVWQHISLDDWKCSLPMLHMQTDRWLRRSSPLPFDVHIHLFAIDNLLPLLAPFLPYINRWRSISITGAREESVSLHDLHIESLDYLIIGIEADPKQTFATASPLAQGSSSMEVGLTSLPTINTISNLNFTTISIIEHSVEAQSTPSSLGASGTNSTSTFRRLRHSSSSNGASIADRRARVRWVFLIQSVLRNGKRTLWREDW